MNSVEPIYLCIDNPTQLDGANDRQEKNPGPIFLFAELFLHPFVVEIVETHLSPCRDRRYRETAKLRQKEAEDVRLAPLALRQLSIYEPPEKPSGTPLFT